MNLNTINNCPGDSRFFKKSAPIALEQIIGTSEAKFVPAYNGRDKSFDLMGIAPLQSATQNEVSFLDNKRYIDLLSQTKAGLIIVSPAFADKIPHHSHALVTKNPYLEWARIASLFYPKSSVQAGIHSSACIDSTAQIDDEVEIQEFVVIKANVKIGKGSIIGSHTVIEQGVQIGENCRIGSHVSLSCAILGNRITLYPGVRIGQDGFGFAISEHGFLSVPQIGKVILKDDVEIGSNSTIDRGSVRDTVIGEGSRIDNLVQIGHNVQMGKCCIVVAQAGISGSTRLEDFVTIAAQAGLIGHIHIGEHARIGAQCGVMSDIDAKSDVIGSPAMPFREFFRNVAFLRRLVKSSSKEKE